MKPALTIATILFFGLTTTMSRARAQMTAPREWKNYETVFGVKNGLRNYDFDVTLASANTTTNVLWPGEQPVYTLQLLNNLDTAIAGQGTVRIIRYGCKGIPDDIWEPEIFRIADLQPIPVKIRIAAHGWMNLDINPAIPEAFGGYALVLDLGAHGSRLITSLIRTFRADTRRMQFPKQSLDDMGPDFLHRIGVQAIRMGMDYTPTTFQDYVAKMEQLDHKLKEYQEKNITVLLMFGAGPDLMPLGTPRSFLDSNNNFLKTKQDYAWLPQLDGDFQEFVRRLCTRYGWPRGPVTAVSLWNEPWEGISISGWQADMLRYREIYSKMAAGVIQARGEGAQVLVGGGDSGSNAWDKLFADGSMDFLPIFDFCSIHYQGMESPALYPEWIDRKSPYGRVKIWDTESWVGNTDDRIGLVVATNRSAGYDRSMGIFAGYLHTGGRGEDGRSMQNIRTAEGEKEVERIPESWSAAAALGAVQHLVGERDFKELLFKKGLPWIMLFDGYDGNADDGTVVVSGDIGEAFGPDNVLFRGVRGEKDVLEKEKIRSLLASTPQSSLAGDSLRQELKRYHPLEDGLMLLDSDPSFRLFDFYGNPVDPVGGKIHIPLTYRGYFLRTDGSRGSFARLTKALRHARIEGYAPVEIIAKDMTARIGRCPSLDLAITNILNRKITGKLTVTLGGLVVAAPGELSLLPHQTRTVPVRIVQGTAAEDNNYLLNVRLDAGKDGLATHEEDMHVNLISRLKIDVDGKLDDWKNVLPQTVSEKGVRKASLTEAAWYPFKNFNTNAEGYANGYLAYDNDYFYFAAKVADKTPHPGAYRFASRPDDDFFYPDTSYKMDPYTSLIAKEGAFAPRGDDGSALQNPSGEGRIHHYLESADNTYSFGMDLRIPDSSAARVAFYLPNLDSWKAMIEVYDQETGALLVSRQVDNLWQGAYEIFELSGKVRIVIRSLDWWYTVKLAGIFFDRVTRSATGASAAYVREDLDTRGNWKGLYGGDGHFIPGGFSRLPVGYALEPARVENRTALVWPAGVRHFTYRKDPVLPDNSGLGYAYDNVLIAFNVIPAGQDGLLANPPGTMPRYTGYKCTDYEYALNQVAPAYGGGTEIWRLLAPGLNRKHFYPRQPRSPGEGAVTDGKLAIVHEGNTRITECAIPWGELPDVKRALDEGRTIKFSFRVNDDGSPGSCLELAKERSVSKRNARAFHPDWKEHWANEVEFGFEK